MHGLHKAFQLFTRMIVKENLGKLFTLIQICNCRTDLDGSRLFLTT